MSLKRFLPFLILGVIVFVSCENRLPKNSDEYKMGLRKPARIIRDEKFSASNEPGGVIQGKKTMTSVFQFIKKGGNLFQEEYFDENDSRFYKASYSFDEKMYPKEKKDSGRLFIPNALTTFQCDDNGNIIIEKVHMEDGTLSYTVNQKFDNSNNIREKRITHQNPTAGCEAPGKQIFEYDSSGNMIAEFLYGEDDSLDSKDTFEYYPNGNIKQGMGRTYEYEYDQYGSWTKKTSFTIENGQKKAESITIRTITYY